MHKRAYAEFGRVGRGRLLRSYPVRMQKTAISPRNFEPGDAGQTSRVGHPGLASRSLARMLGRYRPLAMAGMVLSIFAIGFAVAGADGWGSPAANEAPIGQVSRWCERVSGGLLREPVNTLGNLGFVVAGLAMFWMLGRDIGSGRTRRNRFIAHSPMAILYAASVVLLGPGSMLMHGTHTRFGAWADNVSMVAFILIPWLFNLSVLGGWPQRRFFLAYGLLLCGYAAGYWFVGPDLGIGLDLFGLSIALWVISEVLFRYPGRWVRSLSGLVGFVVAVAFGITPAEMAAAPADYWWVVLFWLPAFFVRRPAPGVRRSFPWFWIGMGSFLAAYAIWLTGTAEHPRCDPDSLLQPHAAWHLLSALATFSFFLYYRSERSLGA
jgi:hypothetical protein